MGEITKALFLLILIWNLLTFILIKIDKTRAIKGRRRVSERTFFIAAFLFGAIGVWAGMYIFRHKTRHWTFKIIIPLAAVCNFYLVYLLHSF